MMREFTFVNGTNGATSLPQLKMMERANGILTEFVVDSGSLVHPVAGQPCCGIEKRVICDKPKFKRVTVDVQQIGLLAKPEVTQPSAVKRPSETIPASSAPSKKGITVRVNFSKRPDGIRAVAYLRGATIEITPEPNGLRPKDGERWQVRMERLRSVDHAANTWTATGHLLRQLPALATSQQSEKSDLIKLAKQELPAFEGEEEAEIIEISPVRGKDKQKRDQWQAYIMDDMAGTTLYVGDRSSPVEPIMNGQLWRVEVGKTIYPKPETGLEYDKGNFRIVLVTFLEKLEVEPSEAVLGRIPPSAGSARERAVREHRRAERRVSLLAKAPKGVGKDQKKKQKSA